MKALLDGLLPRLIPSDIEYLTIAHEGKSDLEASIPRKLRGWRRPGARFIILRDQDNANCRTVKKRLVGLAQSTGRAQFWVRIVCRELESWVLSDAQALAEAFREPRLGSIAVTEPFRNPDALVNPAQELKRLIPTYQKISGARLIGPMLEPSRSSSPSFRTFVATVEAAVAALSG